MEFQTPPSIYSNHRVGYLGLRKLVWGRFDSWVLVFKYISASAGFWSTLPFSTFHLVQQRRRGRGQDGWGEDNGKTYRAFCLSSCFFLICSACRFSFAVGSYGFHFRWAGEISWGTRICAQDDSFIWKALISNLTANYYLIPGSTSDTFHVICNDVLLPQDDVLPPPILYHTQIL